MKSLPRASALAMALLVFVATSETAAKDTWAIFGGTDCGKWVNEPNAARKGWLLGYLSGLNGGHALFSRSNSDPLDQLQSAEQAFLWMDNYCRANPLESVKSGALGLYLELMDRVSPKSGK